MKAHIFDVVVEEDRLEDGTRVYRASCPALKGCHSWGHTHEEALANIREAVELYVEDLQASGEPVPGRGAQGERVMYEDWGEASRKMASN
jgi:predicted RNase H-like HicB family nuclease